MSNTPAPWTVNEENLLGEVDEYHIFIEPGVAVIERKVEGSNQHDMADAQLIASAPELLEALKRANTLLAELTFSEWIPKTDAASTDIRQRINAAHVIASSSIARATGGVL